MGTASCFLRPRADGFVETSIRIFPSYGRVGPPSTPTDTLNLAKTLGTLLGVQDAGKFSLPEFGFAHVTKPGFLASIIVL